MYQYLLTEEKTLLKLLFLKLTLTTKASYFLEEAFYFHWQEVFKNIHVREENYAHTKTFKPDLIPN